MPKKISRLDRLRKFFEKEQKQQHKEQAKILVHKPQMPKKDSFPSYSSYSPFGQKIASPSKAASSNAHQAKAKRNFLETLNNNNNANVLPTESPITPPPKKPKIAVNEIAIAEVEFEEYQPAAPSTQKTKSSNQKRNSHKREKLYCSPTRKKEIGNWGEALVYKKLMAINPKATTVWHNADNEQGLPYDVSQVASDTEDKKYCEVKTTVSFSSSKQKKASFSRNQVAKMAEVKEDYTIARVYGAETSRPTIHYINNPYQKIFHPVRKETKGKEPFKPAFPVVGLKLKI